ncbi:hypothetical protein DAEQUDRAFT_672700 [Daedalea quercina L-15889]|uniref:rRNA-processing protein FYV7 n=1 Tax=Daedalea quercina L-15889 TaxID=1314783 RepID=A0A165P4T8_9APHY|nr:hypothetical protein DAEQUDRAFT_672700 [Daedalea quercina L-15889]
MKIIPADGSKKRKPPTFRHLPINRAKKLKQSWTEAQKIKSQWKAQKRKEGIVTRHSRVEDLVADQGENKAVSSDSTENEGEMSRDGRSVSGSAERENTVADPPSLRDLQRQAYSKASLHPHKSAHRGSGAKRWDHSSTSERAGARERGEANISQTGHSQHRGRGRGQPDMRLRMNAMLEKIKRDFT